MFERFNQSPLWRRFARALWAFDAWVNSSMFESGQSTRRVYDGFATFMDRFHVGGAKKIAVELACEGLTLGLGGAVVVLGLAQGAFRETSDEDWLKKQDIAVTFLDRYGAEVGRRGIKHDDSVPLEQFPDYLIQAALATEDRRFYEHWGIDPIGTLRAVTVNARSSGVVQGGSTITQQLAKNLFLSNERTVERKIKEAFLALWLEFHVSKRDILKLYFDRAYMGGGTFGVQAASDFYFGKSVRDLSLAEAAMLAGLFKAPTKYAPHINLPAARARANDVLSNMVDARFMTEGQVYAARRNPATPVDRKRDVSPDWYLDFAYNEIRELAEANKFGNDRVLTVRTGLDTNIQRKAEVAVEDAIRQYGRQYHATQGAAVIAEPLGLVRAIVGGRDYGRSQFNRAIDAARQPGSSFKPFVYLSAVLTGKFHGNTIVNGGNICLGNWCPHNYGGASAGSLPMVVALEKSLNTVAVWLSVQIGRAKFPANKYPGDWIAAQAGRATIVENARKMGVVHTPLPDTVSLPLGADEVKMIDMVSAYSVFANGGKRAPAYAAAEVRNSRGDVIYRRDRDGPPYEQVMPADKIAEMNNLLKHVVTEGTARSAQLEGVVAAGKTGTTNSYRDAWFDGFTGNYVGSVWFGNDDGASMNNMTGGTLPAKTWHEIMAYAHQGIELKNPYGVTDDPPAKGAAVASSGGAELGAPQRPATLSKKTGEALQGIEDMIRSVEKQKKAQLGAPASTFATMGGGSREPPTLGRRVGLE
jgi:penicillin-binding protein 1A